MGWLWALADYEKVESEFRAPQRRMAQQHRFLRVNLKKLGIKFLIKIH